VPFPRAASRDRRGAGTIAPAVMAAVSTTMMARRSASTWPEYAPHSCVSGKPASLPGLNKSETGKTGPVILDPATPPARRSRSRTSWPTTTCFAEICSDSGCDSAISVARSARLQSDPRKRSRTSEWIERDVGVTHVVTPVAASSRVTTRVAPTSRCFSPFGLAEAICQIHPAFQDGPCGGQGSA
jgi:hypothetical protein